MEEIGTKSTTWDKLINLAVDRGIRVHLDNRLAEKTGVCGVWASTARIRLILVDSNLSQHDRNFVLAHELGHDFLHHSKKPLQYCPDRHVDTNCENQADRFARQLLKQIDHIACLEEVLTW